MNKFGKLLALSLIAILTTLTTSPLLTRTAAQEQQAAPAVQEEDRPGARAQEMPSSVDAPTGYAPVTRTPKEVAATEAVERLKKVEPRVGRPRLPPTMDQGLYESLKNIANNIIPMAKVGEPGKGTSQQAPVPEPQAPAVLKSVNFNGPAEAGWNPPDTHGAVGPNHFVAVTNSKINRYAKNGTLLNSSTLAAFFGYTTKGVFDPRVIYDKASARWIIIAEAFQETATVQRFFVAASKTSDAMGAYWIYQFDVNTRNNDDFFDYPQLGVDKNDIIVTANIFGPSTYREGRVYTFPKATIYAGGTVSFTQYRASFLNQGTIAPPVVLDTSANSFLLTAPNGGSALRLYKLADTATSRLTFYGTVPVTAYSIPPDAPQVAACTSQKLDTVDSRFVNAGT
ncbi:MAG TPA: hypothetical protein VJT74_03180, partial [Pyrinomonadaceae bacterium]|nr:hypothetical protein [Pyrinomonadaceae bacterium]